MNFERSLTKHQILEHYLNRVPMGNNLLGVGIAAQVYFHKRPEQLAPAECALLAALPKAPGTLNPYGMRRKALLSRRNWILKNMKNLNLLAENEYQNAIGTDIQIKPKKFPFEAGHLVDMLLARGNPLDYCSNTQTFETTIELQVQRNVEAILLSQRANLREHNADQACAMVVNNKTLEVIALAGSIQYGARNEGFNNGTLALRSAGSTLKPFLYGLALDMGLTSAEVLQDTEQTYWTPHGDYLPRNFDRLQYGPVLFRCALANSLNVSAIRIAETVGQQRFYNFLMDLGLITGPRRDASYYGLGLAIGNPEVSLEQLVSCYAMLANQGEFSSLRYLQSDRPVSKTAMLSPQAAFIITDILADPAARTLTFGNSLDFPYPVAWKSGTSTRHRDCWLVGYTPKHTVGVWVGNFNGRPTNGLSGVSAAGPIFSQIVNFLYRADSPGPFQRPDDLVQRRTCSYSGMEPTKACPHCYPEWFIKGHEPKVPCSFHRKQEQFHLLNNRYANWVYEHSHSGQTSPYALERYSTSWPNAHLFPVCSLGFPQPRILVSEKPGCSPAKKRGGGNVNAHVSIGKALSPDIHQEAISHQGIEIAYPLDGDRFLSDISHGGSQVLFQASVSVPAPEVVWYVDKVEYARTSPPYSVAWPMLRGKHEVAAVLANGLADQVTIEVE